MEKEKCVLKGSEADAYSQMKKNTVDAKNQLEESEFVRFMNPNGKGKKILFIGNSITLHGKLPSIGWNHEWGMAASEKEKDYVHIVMKKTEEIYPDSQFCICQVAEWERDYQNGQSKLPLFVNARRFCADILIVRLIENCPIDRFDPQIFKRELDSLLGFLNPSRQGAVILTTGFWKHPGDQALIDYAKENNLPCVVLGDLGEQDAMKAIGRFEHEGVANHPGDLGMEKIAERIFAALPKRC